MLTSVRNTMPMSHGRGADSGDLLKHDWHLFQFLGYLRLFDCFGQIIAAYDSITCR